MKNISDGLPVIISDSTDFKCFAGFVWGTVTSYVHDNGTSKFPTHINVKTSLGGGGLDVTLTGNEVIKKSVMGIDITVTISEWKCTPSNLSFHVTGLAKKFIWPVEWKCKPIDKKLSGKRHDPKESERIITEALNKAEKLMAAEGAENAE